MNSDASGYSALTFCDDCVYMEITKSGVLYADVQSYFGQNPQEVLKGNKLSVLEKKER